MAPLRLPPRILVLDDSQDWNDFLMRSMERPDLEARIVSTPEALFQELEQFPAEVLILGMGLQGVDGYELVARIRGLEGMGDLPVLLVMPHGSTPRVSASMEGPIDFVTRPFRRSEFVTRIRALLRLKRLQDNLERTLGTLRSDLDLARTVQQNLLPLPVPSRPGLHIAARYLPCQDLGGDFLDVVDLGHGATGFFLADVVGHGVSSALFTSFLKAQLLHWSLLMQRETPGETLGDMNEALSKTFAGSGRFVTALYATFEPGIERIHLANAGHPPPLYLPAEGAAVFLEGAEIPLGILLTSRYSSRTHPFHPHDRVFLFTDGILEQRRHGGGEIFGRERLFGILVELRRATLEESLDGLLANFRDWIGPAHRKDDIALLAFEALPLVPGDGDTAS